MPDPAAEVNAALEAEAPALYACLSPLGRRVAFPPDIPFQASQARGRAYNGTIGQITDGAGGALAPPSLAGGLGGLAAEELTPALLYSPVEGIAELRRLWRAWQRRDAPADAPSSLPQVTVGLTHALAVAADLFAGEGRALVVPTPFWGNYRQVFLTRTGAVLRTAPAYAGGRYDPGWVGEALDGLPAGEPAVVVVNVPSNPGGYAPTAAERAVLRASLLEEASRRPLVVVCDDAYAGLVYEEAIPRRSLFWELVGAHPDLVPVKVDGATKEVSFFGGRVGFLTFACEPGSAVARALESKVKCLVRAGVGSPVATSQVLLARALRSQTLEAEVEAVRLLLAARVAALREALAACDPALLRPLPFNAGCFALVELPEELGLTSDEVRRHLLEREDTGLVAIAPRYLRIAHCSVAAEALPELVRRLERGVRRLAGRA